MSQGPKLELLIFSHPDYDRVVMELYCDGKYIGFIDQDEGPDRLRLVFPEKFNPSSMSRSVYLDWFLGAVQKAKDRLLNG